MAKSLKQIKSHCPNCGPARYANVLFTHNASQHDEALDLWESTTSYVLECGGCKAVFFRQDYLFSEDIGASGPEPKITHYPPPAKRSKPDWFSLFDLADRALYDLLKETYDALEVDARVLAATGARTIFDRASELLKIDPAVSFKEKLGQLQAKGHISQSEREQLDILTDAGGAAAHRGWLPTPRQLDTIMSIVESFIFRKFVLEVEVRRLKSALPKRQKRKKAKVAHRKTT